MCQGPNSLSWVWSSHLSWEILINAYINPCYWIDEFLPYDMEIMGPLISLDPSTYQNIRSYPRGSVIYDTKMWSRCATKKVSGVSIFNPKSSGTKNKKNWRCWSASYTIAMGSFDLDMGGKRTCSPLQFFREIFLLFKGSKRSSKFHPFPFEFTLG